MELCRFLCKEEIKGKEHGKQLYEAVINGPFKYGPIVVPGTPPTHTSVRDRTYEDLTEPEKIRKAYDIRATNIERESKLYDEFDTFTSEKGETIHSYYLRFAQLINDMHMILMSMQPLQVNIKFVIHLQQEWSKFVTDVKLAKDLHNTNFDHLYSYLRQHEAHANENQYHQQLSPIAQQYYSPPAQQSTNDVPMVPQRSYHAPVANHSSVVHHQSYQAPAIHQQP
ncbi:hypothetical protein Tco_0561927 [Tanacetum coccineum]